MSGRRGIRLLLADVDGTLVTDDKILTDAAIDVVRDLRDAGIAFAITSGRPPRGMRMLIRPLDLQCVIAGFNGGVYVNPDLSVIQSFTLDPILAGLAVDVILGHGLDIWIYTEQEWVIRSQNAPHVAREQRVLNITPTVVPAFSNAHLAAVVKIVAISDNPKLLAACERAARSTIGDRASVACSQTYFLDITNQRANKGAVVATLCERMNIPVEQIATIGDMPTDVLMFRKSGFSIAMGNSSNAVKAQASAVTDSNEKDGFAKAVRKFILAAPNGAP